MSHQLLLPLLLLPLLAPSSSPAAPFDESNGRRFFTLSIVVSTSFRQLLINDKQNVTNFVMNLANDVNCKMSPLGIQVVLLDFNEWLSDQILVDETDSLMTMVRLLPHGWPRRKSHLTVLLGNWRPGHNVYGTFSCRNSVRHLYHNAAAVLAERADRQRVAAEIAFAIGNNLQLTPHVSDGCSCGTGACYVRKNFSSFAIVDEFDVAWTNCSVAKWKSQQQLLDGWLMSEPPDTSYTLQRNISVCGNGIVEPGEQCDFAVGDNCRNPCCNSNCKLQLGATCAHGSCCDLTSCKPKHSGSVCRTKADRQCDVEEICDGVGAECPRDAKVRDGELCQEAGESARCFNGLCGTRSKWCRMLMGDEFSAGSDSCYDRNLNAETGFCSQEVKAGGAEPIVSNVACQANSKLCGRIYCKNSKEDCVTYDVDNLRNSEWNLVPDGASCGSGRFCRNATCVHQLPHTLTHRIVFSIVLALAVLLALLLLVFASAGSSYEAVGDSVKKEDKDKSPIRSPFIG